MTATAASPETTDNIADGQGVSGSNGAILTGYTVLHDGTNNPTVSIYDGTVAAGTLIHEMTHTADEVIVFPEGGIKVAKLSVKTAVAAGTMSATIFYRV